MFKEKNIKTAILYSLLFVLWITGCGYKMGDIIPHQSIAVPIFHNETLYRGYEFLLSKAVVSEILTNTQLKVTSVERADSVLTGKITKIQQNTITKDENRLATELDITVFLELEWKERETGKPLLPKTSISETVEIKASRGQTLEDAITEALKRLARFVIYAMEHPYWQKPS